MRFIKPYLFLFFILISALSIKANTNAAIDTAAVQQFFLKHAVELNEQSNYYLYNQIYQLRNIPYRFSGRTEHGLDCSGFTIHVFDKVYNIELSGGSRDIFTKTDVINHQEMQEGDLVFFKIAKKQISHIGIYLGGGKFAHTTVHGGVMVNDLSESYYKKYFYKATRVLAGLLK